MSGAAAVPRASDKRAAEEAAGAEGKKARGASGVVRAEDAVEEKEEEDAPASLWFCTSLEFLGSEEEEDGSDNESGEEEEEEWDGLVKRAADIFFDAADNIKTHNLAPFGAYWSFGYPSETGYGVALVEFGARAAPLREAESRKFCAWDDDAGSPELFEAADDVAGRHATYTRVTGPTAEQWASRLKEMGQDNVVRLFKGDGVHLMLSCDDDVFAVWFFHTSSVEEALKALFPTLPYETVTYVPSSYANLTDLFAAIKIPNFPQTWRWCRRHYWDFLRKQGEDEVPPDALTKP
jgi:hypothetical protein